MKLLGAIDQGTTSTRFILFSADSSTPVASHQIEFHSIVTQPGWCEHDPLVIMDTVKQCVKNACSSVSSSCTIEAIGITNQRETTVAWDRLTGKPLTNALVWMDTRTKSTIEKLSRAHPELPKDSRKITGLPVSTYFSAFKMRWMLDNITEVGKAAAENRLCLGTIDSWIIWNLSNGSSFVTDVTNASRTMLMNIHSCQWDQKMLDIFGLQKDWLPSILSSCSNFGSVSNGPLKGVSITGVLGDQQASLVGHQCFSPGQAKNTYGTGCFMLFNSGTTPVFSSYGLLTTVAYKLGENEPTVYALEGSIASAGSSVNWLRDGLNMISSAKEIGELAAMVQDSAGVVFVPSLTGLLAPYWDPDARGIITGLSQFTTKHHLSRALLESICLQSREILETMENDAHVSLNILKVDGGMTNSDLFVQIQSNVLGIEVSRPDLREMTALGASFAAGIGSGLYVLSSTEGQLKYGDKIVKGESMSRFDPQMNQTTRDELFKQWKSTVKKCLDKN